MEKYIGFKFNIVENSDKKEKVDSIFNTCIHGISGKYKCVKCLEMKIRTVTVSEVDSISMNFRYLEKKVESKLKSIDKFKTKLNSFNKILDDFYYKLSQYQKLLENEMKICTTSIVQPLITRLEIAETSFLNKCKYVDNKIKENNEYLENFKVDDSDVCTYKIKLRDVFVNAQVVEKRMGELDKMISSRRGAFGDLMQNLCDKIESVSQRVTMIENQSK